MSDYIVGRNAVLELLSNEEQIEKIYVQKGELKGSIEKILGKAKAQKIVVSQVDRKKLDEMANGLPHQGVCALTNDYAYATVEDILQVARDRNEPPFIIILDEIEDPHNLGAIVRTAEVAGCHGIIIPKRRAVGVTSVVHKSAAGATTYIKIAKVNNLVNEIKNLKKQNVFVYGAAGESNSYYNKTNLTGAIALVIGNEGKGLSRLVKENCDELIKIPMFGKVQSLNASNAAAILIYEIVRQRDDQGQ